MALRFSYPVFSFHDGICELAFLGVIDRRYAEYKQVYIERGDSFLAVVTTFSCLQPTCKVTELAIRRKLTVKDQTLEEMLKLRQ